MLRYVFSRLFSLIITLAAASLVIFCVVEVIPGDPASFMLGVNAQEDTIAALRADMGLDRPFLIRYLAWAGGMLSGDFGVSYASGQPVSELVMSRLHISLPLALYALLISTVVALFAGVTAAAKRGGPADYGVMAVTQLGVAIPNFWFAILLVVVFSIMLQWVPSGGFPGWEAGFFPAMKALTLPALALALPQASILARVMRSALIEVMGEDFIRTARAKGLSRRQALWRHGFRNALIPVLTIIGMQFSFLIAGAIIIERVFYLPGLGRLIFQSITARDLIVVESMVMLLVFIVVTVTFLTDLAYALADPRLRRRR